MRATRMSAVVVVGLAVGLTLGWAIWGRAPDYSKRVAQILETNCLPFIKDSTLLTDGLIDFKGVNLLEFADEATALHVAFTARGPKRHNCVVSDVLQPLDLQVWADVYEQMQMEWAPRLTVWNGELPAVLDLANEGGGTPHIMIRPRSAEGYYLSFIKFTHDPRAQIEVGYGMFNRPVGQEETL